MYGVAGLITAADAWERYTGCKMEGLKGGGDVLFDALVFRRLLADTDRPP